MNELELLIECTKHSMKQGTDVRLKVHSCHILVIYNL